jgi:hypothetical protein
MNKYISKIINKKNILLSKHFGKKKFFLKLNKPMISFSFDDFPRSAGINGGKILRDFGYYGTYFISMGLLGSNSPSGRIADLSDLDVLIKDGHEIGCHTFDHFNGRKTNNSIFLDSIKKNRQSIKIAFPNYIFNCFAYPFNGPSLKLKRQVSEYFVCCRVGGNETNTKLIDLSLLKSFFIDWRNNYDIEIIKNIIDLNSSKKGWLIFSTHDVSNNPSRYGCTPQFFKEIVEYAYHSKSEIYSLKDACKILKIV